MATGSSSDQHTLPLYLELGARLPLSHLRYLLLDSSAGEAANELDDIDNAGGRTAEERQTNGRRTAEERHPKPCCQAQDGPNNPPSAAELWTRRQTSDDGESNNSPRFPSLTMAELLLFTFATVLSKSGRDQPLINLFACRPTRQLSLLSHHPLYAQLNSKSYTYARPLKKYDRATISYGHRRAGRRFWVSLSPPNWTLFPPARRDLSAGFNTGLGNNTGRNQLWTSGREGGR